jgi:ATP-binding cassette subfamily F protein 3
LIDIKSLRLSFGEKVIFGGVDWRIADRDRVGLVGDNGTGKTTFLRVLTKEVEPDDGVVERSKNLTVGYLPQDLVELEDTTVLDYLKRRAGLSEIEERLRAAEHALAETDARTKALTSLLSEHGRLERQFEHLGGFEFESTARKVLHGLGFAPQDGERSCMEFSGGWKMRIALAALLLSRPDVLLLDEPTNHLDTESMEWLEGWLRDYRGAVVAVSHDRRFLDNMTERTAELARGKLTLYPWNYRRYLAEKDAARERLEKTIQEQKERVGEMERFISRFRYKSSKAAQVQSRIKLLEKMEVQELDGPSKAVRFRIPEAPESGWETLSVKNLSKSYGEPPVFGGVNFTINRGEHVALVGVNGAGKSTLLRLLSGVEEPTDGVVRMGHNVKCAFYSQESARNVNYSHTVWEEARQTPSKLTEAGKRTLLGSFLFWGVDIHK